MPYSYKNAMNLQGSEKTVQAVLLAILDPGYGSGSISFERITPMPAWAARNEPLRESWMMEQWGVSANAGGLADSVRTYDGGSTIEFTTVGADVRDLMRKLSLMFPELEDLIVDYLWASADVGNDAGMLQYQGGEQTYEYIPAPGSMEAYELAFDVFGTEAAKHGLVFDPDQGTYRYSGSDGNYVGVEGDSHEATE